MTAHLVPRLFLLSVAGCILLLGGCGPTAEDEHLSLAATEFSIRINDPATRDAVRPLDADAMQQRLEHRSRFGNEVGRVIHTSRSWQEAHRRVQRLIEGEADPGWSVLGQAYRQQYVAGYMLHLEPLRLSTSPEALDAKTRYVEILVGHASPEIPLIAETLRGLDGHLPEQEHAALASRALGAAQAELARRVECEDCPMERLREQRPELFGADAEHAETRLAIAIEQLERMAR